MKSTGQVRNWSTAKTTRTCETGDHLSLGFGIGIGLPLLFSASVKGTFDQDLQENRDVSSFLASFSLQLTEAEVREDVDPIKR